MHPSRPSEPSRGFIAFTRCLVVLLCAGVIWGGGLAIRQGVTEYQMHDEATLWPVVEGRVERGWVRTIESLTGRAASRYHNTLHEVMVDYTYSVRGESFAKTGAAPRQIVEEEGKAVAETIATSYAPGTRIAVFYRPDHPSDSRLRRVEVSADSWWLVTTLGTLLTISALLVIWWVIFRYERPPAAPAKAS